MSNSFNLLSGPSRGKYNVSQLQTDSDIFVDVLNILNCSGKLAYLHVGNGLDTNLELRLTIDDIQFSVLSFDSVDQRHCVIVKGYFAIGNVVLTTVTAASMINLEFNSSLHIEIRRTLGTVNILSQALYQLD